MHMIPAPSRVLKQASTWILIAQGTIDLALVAWHALAVDALHFISTEQAIIGNIVLTFLAGVAKLVQQHIPLTEEQKAEIVLSINESPTKVPK